MIRDFPDRFAEKPLTLVMRGVRKWRKGEETGGLREVIRKQFPEDFESTGTASRLTGIVSTTGPRGSNNNLTRACAATSSGSNQAPAGTALDPVKESGREAEDDSSCRSVKATAVPFTPKVRRRLLRTTRLAGPQRPAHEVTASAPPASAPPASGPPQRTPSICTPSIRSAAHPALDAHLAAGER